MKRKLLITIPVSLLLVAQDLPDPWKWASATSDIYAGMSLKL